MWATNGMTQTETTWKQWYENNLKRNYTKIYCVY